MSFSLAVALILLPEVPGRAAVQADAPDPRLLRLERELGRKIEQPGLDRTSPEYLDFAGKFRVRLDAELARVAPTSANKGLHAEILARLGGSHSQQAEQSLKEDLTRDPGEHALRVSYGQVLFERKKFPEAAAQAQALLDPNLKPPPSKEVLERARTLWFMSKDRVSGEAHAASAPKAKSQAQASAKAPGIAFSPPVRRKQTSAPPDLRGVSDLALEATRSGRRTLEKSALGRDVLHDSRVQGVRYELVDMPADAGAQYDWKRKTILVPRGFEGRDPVEAAVIIGHECFHARQQFLHGMVPSIESEQDAAFADRVIYHELLKAGERPLPRGTVTEENYRVFAEMIRYQRFARFNEDVKFLYAKQRAVSLNKGAEKIPIPLRSVLRWLFTAVDADFLRDFETLDDQEKKWWNIPERPNIWNAKQAHRIEQSWQLKWMKEHQRDFPPAVWPRSAP